MAGLPIENQAGNHSVLEVNPDGRQGMRTRVTLSALQAVSWILQH